jgi:hypothetical protein
LVRVRDVSRHDQGLGPGLPHDGVDLLQEGFGSRCEYDLRPFASGIDGQLLPQPRPDAGDDHDLVLEDHRLFPFSPAALLIGLVSWATRIGF